MTIQSVCKTNHFKKNWNQIYEYTALKEYDKGHFLLMIIVEKANQAFSLHCHQYTHSQSFVYTYRYKHTISFTVYAEQYVLSTIIPFELHIGSFVVSCILVSPHTRLTKTSCTHKLVLIQGIKKNSVSQSCRICNLVLLGAIPIQLENWFFFTFFSIFVLLKN